MCSRGRGGKPLLGIFISVYLKIDLSALQPVGTSLVEEVEVFYEQAEERDDNLQDNRKRKGFNFAEKMQGGFHMTHRGVISINIDSKKKRITIEKDDIV